MKLIKHGAKFAVCLFVPNILLAQGCRTKPLSQTKSIQAAPIQLEEQVLDALQKNKEIGLGELDTSAIDGLVVVKLPKDRQSGAVVKILDSIVTASKEIATLERFCEKTAQSQETPSDAQCGAAFAQHEYVSESKDNSENFQILSELVMKPYLTEQDETLSASNGIIKSFLERQFNNSQNDIKNYRVTWTEKNFEHALLVSYSARESTATVLSYRVSL